MSTTVVKIFFYPSTDNYKNHKGGMSNFRVVSRGIKKIVTNHYHDSWPMAMALCVHSKFILQDLCHEYFRKFF
jgi:hypothetical protein